jgi:hypothetical protein
MECNNVRSYINLTTNYHDTLQYLLDYNIRFIKFKKQDYALHKDLYKIIEGPNMPKDVISK